MPCQCQPNGTNSSSYSFLFFCGGQPWFLCTEVLLSQGFLRVHLEQGGKDLGAFVFVCRDQHLVPNPQKKHGFNTRGPLSKRYGLAAGGVGD